MIDPTNPVLIGITTGAVGGFIANFCVRWGWHRYKEPNLNITGEVEKFYVINRQDELEEIYYRVPVRNTGRTAARNCKPKIHLAGEGGYSDSTRWHEVKSAVCWSEKNNPARITINPGETATFDLLRQEFEDGSGAISFPSEEGWDATAPIVVQWIDPESVSGKRYSEPQNLERGKGMSRINNDAFDEIEWVTQTVEVTAENTEKVDGFLHIQKDEEEFDAEIVPR